MTEDMKNNMQEGVAEGAAEGVAEGVAEGAAEAAAEQEEKKYIASLVIDIGVLPGFMLRKVGQAYMVMPTGPRMKEYEGVITLNETGAFLFKESQKPEPTKKKLIEACMAEYGATAEEALKAVDAFVIQCAECGIFAYRKAYFDKKTGEKVSEDVRK